METGGASKPVNDAKFGIKNLQRGLGDTNKTDQDYEEYLRTGGGDQIAYSGNAGQTKKTDQDYQEYLRMGGGDQLASCGNVGPTNKTVQEYEEYLRMGGNVQVASCGDGTSHFDSNHLMEDDGVNVDPQPLPRDSNTIPIGFPGAFAHDGPSTEPPVQRMVPRHRPVHPVNLSRLTSPDSGIDGEGLVEALPVTDELSPDPSTLVRASPAEESQSAARKRRKEDIKMALLFLVALVCVSMLAVLIAWGSGAMDKQEEAVDAQYNGTPVADQGKQPTTPQDYLKQYLPDETLRDLGNSSSSQYLAFQWLHQDPSLFNYSEARLRQRFALATFFHATNGNTVWAQRNSWLDYLVHECDWYFAGAFKIFGSEYTASSPCSSLSGIGTDNNTNHTAEETYKLLWLSRNNLTGSIPRELYWLTSLESIDLAVNRVKGSIASDHIQALQNLRQLSFPANELTGPIPSGLSVLSKLEILYFGKNFMTGTLPMELAFLNNTLTQLTIHSNNFRGTIPSRLSELSHLTLLGLNYLPFLTGTIPTEWGRLSSLEYVYAFGNPQLTGSIPSEVGLMTNLAWLHLNGCQLSGSLPSTLGKLAPTLKELVLFDNRLTSSLPTELGLLASMYFFAVGANDLTGTIPSEIGKLAALQELDLHGNGLNGTVPPELSALTMLEDFNAAQTDFSGTIPGGNASWPAILRFNVTGTPGLQGTIPKAFCYLSRNESKEAGPQTRQVPISDLLTESFLDFDCSETLCGCDCQCLD
jgi:Leucine-rich repeat (LRR) protein